MSVDSVKKHKYSGLINPAGIFQFIINLLGLYLIFKAALVWNTDMLWVYIFWLLFSTATELKPISMPNNDQLTVSFAVHISALILFGVPIAILSSTVANIITDIVGRRGWKKMLFNVNQYAVTIYCSWFIYHLVRSGSGPLELKADFLAMVLSCLTYVVVNFLLVSTVISLSQGTRWLRQLTNDVKLEMIHFVTLVPVSLLIVILYNYEPLSIIILLLPLAMAHFSFDNYMTLRTETKNTIEVLADIIDKRDAYTAQHSYRVANYCEAIAHKLKLNQSDYETLITAARVHDLGKISVPDSILLKNQRLQPEERNLIIDHAMIGFTILSNLRFYKSGAKFVFHHHERYDGTGYPHGLKGDQIPLGARIMAVADSYDAMTSDRPYRKAMSVEEALTEIINNSGTQFDPSIVEVFVQIVRNELGVKLKSDAI
ncbi:Cyclic di-GMP phosphodiesterase response regulator RpfG [Pelotomaculum schinkii]|uniref:Cyclic di-GMP phosphodiesterase response regulator RpfG n=1 Tax=Pelotomaculum schinkii TaxID=78350 RepID=A0A4Y7RH72_9FIRM|nr:HD-GYP domain-containing protein [Pelotomaculum schinkii]TEB08042.1 Cyclic di-GMP phosphodiesterase response regulator RpfG [Pelotomaculum schinkii]